MKVFAYSCNEFFGIISLTQMQHIISRQAGNLFSFALLVNPRACIFAYLFAYLS